MNYFHWLLIKLDWSKFFSKGEESTRDSIQIFNDRVFKLHGSIKHNEWKVTYSAFDKADSAILFATDVASRGLDFKTVTWVVQYDLHTEVKEYANRIGWTARLTSTGSSVCFVSQGTEEKYIDYLSHNGCKGLHPLNRFAVLKSFTKKLKTDFNIKHKGDRVFKRDPSG